ncbi:MAG: M18 family aminopeptidase [Pseudomonadales bacterium]|jgi:aspartyl aminopeptidase|nr:M18 family aminopeptidase [Pseudomonadales bacterium]
MLAETFNRDLCDFIQQSPTPFHAVAALAARLEQAGYVHLAEAEPWELEPGGRYYITRNDSSLIALQLGSGPLSVSGLRMVGAHTDSPCLKIKPQPELWRHGYLQLGVEVYGGALLNPWFDRDLSLAGRVVFEDDNGELGATLINFERPLAVIPSLAIHLDREVNNKRSINAQTDLPPLLLQCAADQVPDFRELLAAQARRTQPEVARVLDYELCLYDVNPPDLVGLNEEFIAAARLDNLLSCYVGLQSLLLSRGTAHKLLLCSDHEEVGSASAAGASGPFLESVLRRLAEKLDDGSEESFQRMLRASFLVSSDNAHGIHPNFPDRHDGKHGPLLNAGPVLKFNANQRYATNSTTAAYFRLLCEEVEVPLQNFVVRSDMGCGSTIGPLIATELGLPVLDIGVPTFAMHSIRELAGSQDTLYLARALTRFYTGEI